MQKETRRNSAAGSAKPNPPRKLTRAETRRLEQARKLLAQALDPANTPELATQAHTKAHELLDEVGLIIPERLTATTVRSIEALHQTALPAGSPQ